VLLARRNSPIASGVLNHALLPGRTRQSLDFEGAS
jgi:hypothetical protein